MAGPLDGLVEGAKSVGVQTLTRGKRNLADAVAGGIKDLAGEATGGLVGNRNAGQPQQQGAGTVQRRAESPVGTPAAGLNGTTQNFLNQFGGTGAPARPSLAETLNPANLLNRLTTAVMPSQPVVDRLKQSGAAIGATVAGGVEAVRRIGDKPTAEEIAAQVASGKLDGHVAQEMINAGKVQLPDPSTIGKQRPAPVEDRSFRAAVDTNPTKLDPPTAAATPAAPAERNWFQRTFLDKPTAAAAAVSTAVAVAVTPAPAKPDAPEAPLATPAQIVAATSQQRPTMQLQEPAVTPVTRVTMEPLAASTIKIEPLKMDAAITAPVKPTEEFAAAAAGKPSPTAQLDAMISQERDASRLKTLEGARAQIQANYGGPSNG